MAAYAASVEEEVIAAVKPFHRQISYGHRAMYLGPAALLAGAKVSVIDVGCGDGYGYHALRESHSSLASYWGIDSNPNDIAHIQKLITEPHHIAVCGDWLSYPEHSIPPSDFVFCVEVLEHVPADRRRACIEKCARLARRNVFISTPPADRNEHGRLTIPECRDLIRSVGLDVVVIDAQWTTLYVCSTLYAGKPA